MTAIIPRHPDDQWHEYDSDGSVAYTSRYGDIHLVRIEDCRGNVLDHDIVTPDMASLNAAQAGRQARDLLAAAAALEHWTPQNGAHHERP